MINSHIHFFSSSFQKHCQEHGIDVILQKGKNEAQRGYGLFQEAPQASGCVGGGRLDLGHLNFNELDSKGLKMW